MVTRLKNPLAKDKAALEKDILDAAEDLAKAEWEDGRAGVPGGDSDAAREADSLAAKAFARQQLDEIKHGSTPSKATVPTQIRVLQTQLDDLKVITGIDRSNVSAILRALIAQYISDRRKDPLVADALDAAERSRLVMEQRSEQGEWHTLTDAQCEAFGKPVGTQVLWTKTSNRRS